MVTRIAQRQHEPRNVHETRYICRSRTTMKSATVWRVLRLPDGDALSMAPTTFSASTKLTERKQIILKVDHSFNERTRRM